MIEVRNLVKRYRYLTAVDNVSFELGEGEVLGLVGPNGAGKTTTIKSILGLVVPDQGSILVDGVDPLRDPSVKRKIAYVPEIPQAPEWATVCGLLESLGVLEGLSRVEARRRALEALEEFGVRSLCNRKMKMTSKGQRKRILLAQAVLTDKSYVLLDEPVSGLDPEWVAAVRRKILEWRNSGIGVLVSSHILKELQEIVDRVVILSKGRKVFEGTLRELASIVGVKGIVTITTPAAPDAARILENEGYKVLSVTGKTLRVEVENESSPKRILGLLEERGISIEGFEYREASLEDAYMRLVR